MLALPLCALALAACTGQTPAPTPIIKTVEVAVPVARSCVPAGLAERPTDLPASKADFQAKLRGAPDIAARYQMTADWALGFMARNGEIEPVIAGCRKAVP